VSTRTKGCRRAGCAPGHHSRRRKLARRASQLGDDGSNDFLVSEVLRTNEFQVWFLSEHLVKEPLVDVKEASSGA